jgi:hypothetical protein
MLNDITQAELVRLLNYNPETGVFTYGARRCGVTLGRVAGTIDSRDGYQRIILNGRHYLGHRLAWLYVHGEWPKAEIDHRDGDRSNNTISNLRCATRGENQRNKPTYKNNATGAKGVHWHKQHRKYAAVIQCNGKSRHLGLFTTIEAASAAYQAASKQQVILKHKLRDGITCVT